MRSLCLLVISAYHLVSDAAPSTRATKYRLENGLEVILEVNRRLPIVALEVAHHVGPANESLGHSGMAHLFEHIMLGDSGHIAKSQRIEMVGWFGGQHNAATSFDWTRFFTVGPADALETMLWLQSDRVGFFLQGFSTARLHNQIDVVHNERRQAENTPYGRANFRAFELLFPYGHPYHYGIPGSHKDIQATTESDVRDFYTQFFGPGNSTLVVAGDIDIPSTRTLIQTYFGSLTKTGVSRPPLFVSTPANDAPRVETIALPVKLSRVTFAWRTSPAFAEGDPELSLGAAILGEGKSSLLYRNLVLEQRISADIHCDYLPLSLGSVFRCDLIANPGISIDRLTHEFDLQLARLQSSGPSGADLERARKSWKIALWHRLETLVGRVDLMNEYNHYVGNPNCLDQDVRRHEVVTPGGVQRAAQRWLPLSQRVTVIAAPLQPRQEQ